MRGITRIVLHCSDSLFGDAALIDEWHRARKPDPFRCIGYHYVILNGYPTAATVSKCQPVFTLDGAIEDGRPIAEVGAHALGSNEDSIGVCLIGRDQFTCSQFRSLSLLIGRLEGCLNKLEVVGHCEVLRPGDDPKTCPNIDMEWLRWQLS